MILKVGEPIVLQYKKRGTISKIGDLYYLGLGVYGFLEPTGFVPIGLTITADYVIPTRCLNLSYGYKINGKLETNRLVEGYNYDDFTNDKIIDEENPNLYEMPWYNNFLDERKRIIEKFGK